MNIFDIFKKREEETIKLEKEIKIIIDDNETPLFYDENESIISVARELYKTDSFDSYKEAIIYAATIFRGLTYKETIEDENTIIIVFEDKIVKSLSKKYK